MDKLIRQSDFADLAITESTSITQHLKLSVTEESSILSILQQMQPKLYKWMSCI